MTAGSALSNSRFATSSATGGIAASSGEAISQAITGSARRAIVTSASTEVILSPGVANAEKADQGGVSG